MAFAFKGEPTRGEKNLRGEAKSAMKKTWITIFNVCIILALLTYVVLYVLKTFVQNRLVLGYEMEAVMTTVVTKGVTSLTNGIIAVVVAVILNKAIRPSLEKAGIFD